MRLLLNLFPVTQSGIVFSQNRASRSTINALETFRSNSAAMIDGSQALSSPAAAMSFTLDDENHVLKDTAASLQDNTSAAAVEARLRVYCPQEIEHFGFFSNAYREWNNTNRNLADAKRTKVFLPHAICTSSLLHRFFSTAPPDFFQLNRLAVDVLSPSFGAGDTPSHFATSNELTAFFQRLTVSSSSSDAAPPRIRVCGRLCGDAAVLAEFGGRLSSVVFSFEAVVRPNVIDPANFILDLTKDARYNQDDEQASERMKNTPLHRPQSLQRWWTEAEETRLLAL